MSMVIYGPVVECDFTGKTYNAPVDGGHCLVRGATGRVCCTMHVGPEYLEQSGWEISTREEAEAWALDYPGGSIDF